MNTAIAAHLNVLESAIVRIEEWKSVLFVVVRGIGARFVSKKVVKMSEVQMPDPTVNRYGHRVWEIDGARVEEMSNGFCPAYEANGYYALISGVGHRRIESLEDVMQLAIEARQKFVADQASKPVVSEEQKNRAFAASVGMMQTSTGKRVTADEWDAIEGAM